ncbi:unnamed protein product, partial [Symbiodinium pilosum]
SGAERPASANPPGQGSQEGGGLLAAGDLFISGPGEGHHQVGHLPLLAGGLHVEQEGASTPPEATRPGDRQPQQGGQPAGDPDVGPSARPLITDQ